VALLAVGAAWSQENVPGAPGAPEAEDPRRHFDALVDEIASLQRDLDGIEGRQRTLLGEVERLDLEVSLHYRELEKLALQREQATIEQDSLAADLERTREEVHEGEERLARHLRDVYTAGRGRDLRVLLAIEEPEDLLRSMAYLDAMARRQAESLERLDEDRVRMSRLDDSLREQAGSIEILTSREQERALAREAARDEAAALLRRAREDAEAHRKAIAELTRAAEDLERAIVSGVQQGDAAGGAIVDIDVAELKGVLEWPVEGRVVIPFGDVTHPRFGTVTPHPGLDIETEPRSPVRAILGGRVVFGRRFEGYGNTVLIDHGRGYLSIYARLGTLRVGEGDDVLPRQTIGLSADEGLEGGAPLVYFELRTGGSTVDPAAWLRQEPA